MVCSQSAHKLQAEDFRVLLSDFPFLVMYAAAPIRDLKCVSQRNIDMISGTGEKALYLEYQKLKESINNSQRENNWRCLYAVSIY